MRILHIVQGYAPAVGGTELLIQRVSEELVRRFGDDVTVFTTDCYNAEAFFRPDLPHLAAGWDEVNGVRVRRFPVRRRVSAMLRGPQAWAYRFGLPGNERLRALAAGPIVPGLQEAIAEWPADVVSAASFPLLHMFDARDAARASRRPLALTGCLHPHDAWGFDRAMIYQAIAGADAYVALTDFEADYVVARGASRERVHTAGVGVDPSPYQGVSQEEAKWRLGFDRRPLVGFVGQLAGHKGVDTLLSAMPLVWEEEADVNLMIAGSRTLFTPVIEQVIGEWPADFRRRTRLMVGFADDRKPALFNALDLLAYPSGYESFGISYVEAWACGKPVIGARSGAVPTVIAEGLDGLLVDYRDAKGLAQAILDLVRNPSLARQLGETGRAKALERYTWEKIAAVYHGVYERLVRGAVAVSPR
jgi:glycosyltransferase involved in cell wall biosynthesis